MRLPTVLVLASGRGERFLASGGRGSKLTALLGGKPVLQRTLDSVRASGLPWHLESERHEGMGDSIAAAVRATHDAAGWLVLPGDLPLIRCNSLQRVADALKQDSVVVPRYGERRGHPVGFGEACRDELLVLRGNEGAASVVRNRAAKGEVTWLDMDDPGVVADIDTLADLAYAEQLLRG